MEKIGYRKKIDKYAEYSKGSKEPFITKTLLGILIASFLYHVFLDQLIVHIFDRVQPSIIRTVCVPKFAEKPPTEI